MADCKKMEEELKAKIEAIPGCKCGRSGCNPQYTISCTGDLVTSETIKNLLAILGGFKPDPRSRWVNILAIYNTKLVELDLTPFLNIHFSSLSISHNPLLTTIKGPPLSNLKPEELIHADHAHISFNPLVTDEGFGEALKYFDPAVLYDLNLWGMKLEGSLRSSGGPTENVPEFLPGLSAFKNLHGLEFAQNQITRLGGGQFRENAKLNFLNLRENPIKEIWKDAFEFRKLDSSDELMKADSYITLVLEMSKSGITNGAFIHNQLEWTSQRPIHWDLVDNKVESMTGGIFETFLNAHENNKFSLGDNPLVADERIKWLSDQKEKFERRINLYNRNHPDAPQFQY